MNKIYILSLFIPALIFIGCEATDDIIDRGEQELAFASEVLERANGSTRAVGDNFFTTGSQILVELTTNRSGAQMQKLTYTYGSDRIFRGTPSGFHFSLDDTKIATLTARWPADGIRDEGVVTDQTLLENYKAADWMTGAVSGAITNIMPTDAPVPLVFERENVLLDFELAGQNTTGLDIESLIIELTSSSNIEQAYHAYCENPNGHAELIVEAGSKFLSPDNYLIGRIKVSGEENTYTIIFPQTNITLEAGHRYLITLTPQGYFMSAYVSIVGFADGTEGIAIPFQQPGTDGNGNFTIDTPLQLIGMSYLIRNYDGGKSYKWSTKTYIISDNLVVTDEYAAKYIPIPQTSFTGSIQNSNGQSITQLSYGNGNILELFN